MHVLYTATESTKSPPPQKKKNMKDLLTGHVYLTELCRKAESGTEVTSDGGKLTLSVAAARARVLVHDIIWKHHNKSRAVGPPANSNSIGCALRNRFNKH